jgi:predicted phage baseplate assembly protein
MYTESPRIANLHVVTLGAATRATHAVVVNNEVLGQSSGEPGQVFRTQHAPVLSLREGETVEIEALNNGELGFVPWHAVTDFAASNRYDRHFQLDEASGEVSFGPSVRQPDGTVRQYGRVPEAGRRLRLSRYRYGGGTAGNVPTGSLQVLRTAIPYIDHVTNLVRAEGGRDQETLEEVRMRAARELRAQWRAVTADDYENLARQTSRAVARVKCRAPRAGSDALPPGMIEILVVPAAADAIRYRDYSKLEVDTTLRQAVEKHLDQYRLLTTTVRVREPLYLGIQAHVQIVTADGAAPDVVRARVIDRLETFICPLALPGDDTSQVAFPGSNGPWEGWPFGRSLYTAEIYSLVQQVPGVKHVLDVRLSRRPVIPTKESPAEGSEDTARGLAQVSERMIEVADDTLLCSLDHQVEMVEV